MGKLLGIEHSNRADEELWSKNRFNSTFPVALANYIWTKTPHKAKYVTVNANFDIIIKELKIEDLFNCSGLQPSDLYFSFEDVFAPYERYIEGGFSEEKKKRPRIDLVVKKFDADRPIEGFKNLRPLEIKMTVVPDNSTLKTPENPGSELVIRPTTTLYAALGLLSCCRQNDPEIVSRIFSSVHRTLSHDDGWRNNHILIRNSYTLKTSTEALCKTFHAKQVPLLMQPIWKTNGIDHELDKEKALDLVVWSNLAYIKLLLSKVDDSAEADTAARATRALSKFAQYLYQSCTKTSRKINLTDVYVPQGYQTDKELAINGMGTREFLSAPKSRGGRNDTLINPRFPRNVIREIILNDGQDSLKPERRFDQSLYIMNKTGLYASEDF